MISLLVFILHLIYPLLIAQYIILCCLWLQVECLVYKIWCVNSSRGQQGNLATCLAWEKDNLMAKHFNRHLHKLLQIWNWHFMTFEILVQFYGKAHLIDCWQWLQGDVSDSNGKEKYSQTSLIRSLWWQANLPRKATWDYTLSPVW